MADEILRTLITELKLSAASWNNDIKAAQRDAKAFATEWKASVTIIKEVGTAMSAVGDIIAGGMFEMAKKTAEYGAELERLSQKSGASVQDLARLGVAAEENGSSLDGLSNGLKFISKNMELASQGSKAQVAAFNNLGISTKDLTAVHGSATAMFALLADRIKGMADPSEHAADLTKVLGKSWTELVPTLSLGSDGLRQVGEEAEKTGKVLSDTAAQQDLEFAKAWEQVKASLEGVGIAIGSALIPVLIDLAGNLRDGLQWVSAFSREHEDLTKAIFAVAAAIGGAGGLLLGLAGFLTILPALTEAWALLNVVMTANPIGVVIVAIGALVAALVLFRNEIAGGLAEAYGFLLNGLADIVDAAYRAAASLGMKGLANSLSTAGNSIRETAADLKDMGSVLLATEPVIKDQGRAHAATAADIKTHYEATRKLTDSVGGLKDAYSAQRAEADALKVSIEVMDNATKDSTELIHLATKAHWDLDDAMKASAASAVATATAEMKLEAAIAAAMPDFAQQLYNVTQAQRDFNSVMGIAPEIVVKVGENVLTTAKNYDIMSAAAEKNATALQKATNDVKNSAGKIFDDMFVKGESVFAGLQNALKGGALSLGRAIFEDVTGALLGPVKKAFDDFFSGLVQSLGLKKLGNAIGGALAGALGLAGSLGTAGASSTILGGTAAFGLGGMPAISALGGTGGTAAAAGGIGISGAAIGATAGIAAAVVGTIAWLKSQAHWEANTFVKEIQNPFGGVLSQLSDSFSQAEKAGDLTKDAAKAAKSQIEDLWKTFQSQANQFASQGKDQAEVVSNAFGQLNPLMTQIFSDIDVSIGKLSDSTSGTTSAIGDTIVSVDALTKAYNDQAAAIAATKAMVAASSSDVGTVQSYTDQYGVTHIVSHQTGLQVNEPKNPLDAPTIGKYQPGTGSKQIVTPIVLNSMGGLQLLPDVKQTVSNPIMGSFASYASGIDYVPRDMWARIHRGEAVVPASQNRGNADLAARLDRVIALLQNGLMMDGQKVSRLVAKNLPAIQFKEGRSLAPAL